VEHLYHWEATQTYVPREAPLVGASVEKDGNSYRLPPDYGTSGMWPRPESAFPHGSELCLRREALDLFLQSVEGPKRPAPQTELPQEEVNDAEKPLDARERDTLLLMIKALAKEAKVDISQPFKAAETIAHLIEELGYNRALGTIANHLKTLNKELPTRTKKADKPQ
jgi:hypothetical protein